MPGPDPPAAGRPANRREPSLTAGLLLGAAGGALLGTTTGHFLLWIIVGGCLGLLLVLVFDGPDTSDR